MFRNILAIILFFSVITVYANSDNTIQSADIIIYTVSFFLLLFVIGIILWYISNSGVLSHVSLTLIILLMITYFEYSQKSTNSFDNIYELVSIILYTLFFFLLGSSIKLKTNFQSSPALNTIFLLLSSLAAVLIGSIGATVALADPLFRMNSNRKKIKHIPVFFIIVVSNLSGLINPLTHQSSYILLLRGYYFSDFTDMMPVWFAITGFLLLLFYIFDRMASLNESIKYDRPLDLANRLHRSIQRQAVPQSLLLNVVEYLETPRIIVKGIGKGIIAIAVIMGVYFIDQGSFSEWYGVILFSTAIIILLLSNTLNKAFWKDFRIDEFSYILCATILVVSISNYGSKILFKSYPELIYFIHENALYMSAIMSLAGDNSAVTLLFSRPEILSGDINYLKILTPRREIFHNLKIASPDYYNSMLPLLSIIMTAGSFTVFGNISNLLVRKIAIRNRIEFPSHLVYFTYLVIPVFTILLTIILIYN